MKQKEVASGLYHKPLRLLPVFFSRDIEKVYWNWVLPREENAPKPRNLLREKEVPPEDLSLNNLSNVLPFVEVLPALKISPDGGELREIPKLESDVIVISGGQEDLIHIMRQYGKPIIPLWDNWGYIWNIRYLSARDSYTYTPFGAEEVKQVLHVLHARKFINNLKVIYFGDMPSHTVSESNYDFDGLQRQLGVSFVKKELDDYVKAVGEVSDDESLIVADKWKKYEILDNREAKINFFAKIYVALKKLLNEEGAMGFTVDCAALPNDNYVNNNISVYEGYYASVIFAFLSSLGFEVRIEDHSNHGRVDMTITGPESIFILEFKVNMPEESAIYQIETKKYYEKYQSENKMIYLIGIHFDSNERNIVNFEWKKL